MTQNTEQKKEFDALLKLGLKHVTVINKENSLKAIQCFEAIPQEHFPGVYKPMLASVYTNLGKFLIIDKNYKQAEIYLNKALEFGTFLVPVRLGHVNYLQNNLKEAVDFYMQGYQKLGFIEEVFIEIRDDFYDFKISEQNAENLIDFLSKYKLDNTIDINALVKEA